MKSTSTKKSSFKKGKTMPLTEKEDVQANPDNKIDQDFPGFPHSPAKEEIINPKTSRQKKVADTDGHEN